MDLGLRKFVLLDFVDIVDLVDIFGLRLVVVGIFAVVVVLLGGWRLKMEAVELEFGGSAQIQ